MAFVSKRYPVNLFEPVHPAARDIARAAVQGKRKKDIKLQRISLFHAILKQAVEEDRLADRVRSSIKWFYNRAREVSSHVIKETDVTTGDRQRKTAVFGKMFFFAYDPKHKLTLPYYDTFPLIFVLQPAAGGFLGMNFHYISVARRIALLTELYNVISDNKFNERTKLTISYNILKGVSNSNFFKPCIKHYLHRHVRSSFYRIEAIEWPIAITLPVAEFQKKSEKYVWRKSNAIINRG